MNDLRPCPFCGSKKVDIVQKARYNMNVYAGTDRYVLCIDCCSSTAHYISDHDAINAWNRRAKEEKE